MYFPSKKDLWLYPIYWGCIFVCFTPFYVGRDYGTLFFLIPLAILLVWSWFTTGYKVDNENLIIQYGPVKKKIPIKDIRKIRKTKNPLSAPALSFDRLEISYGSGYGFGMALISPKDKQSFVSLLKSKNPQIEVDTKIKL
jgi:Bacterial PH domain